MLSFTNASAVTTDDVAQMATAAGLYIGGAGDVKVTMAGPGRSIVVFKAVPVGTVLPIQVVQVFATGTTATNILALR